MKRIIVFIIFVIFAFFLLAGSADNKEFDLKVEEGHSLEQLLANGGCVIYEVDPFHICVNGKDFLCDMNTLLELCNEDVIRSQKELQAKLNRYSDFDYCWLFLRDQHNTAVDCVRIGRDPFEFYPELPAATYDNRGNLISLNCFDINRGYYQYTFLYDNNDRIIYAEERCYKVSLSTAMRSKTYSCDTHEWRYNEDSTFLCLSKHWNELLSIDKPDFIFIGKYSDGYDYCVRSYVYSSEEEFQEDEQVYAEWAGAKTTLFRKESEE